MELWALRELDGGHVVDVCELWADEGEFVKVGRVLAKDKNAFSRWAFTHIAMAGGVTMARDKRKRDKEGEDREYTLNSRDVLYWR
jgi:hypothetical protein